MAMTAACTLSSATATAGGAPVLVTCTVTNTSTVAVKVLAIRPIAYASGTAQKDESVRLDIPDVNPSNCSVAGSSGTKAYQFGFQFYGPQVAGSAGQGSGPATQAIDVVCEVRSADGTTVYTAAQTVTVSASPHN